MKIADSKYKRQSTRLAGYDYSKSGYYFVTICTHDRQLLFGDINDDKIKLNPAGRMVDWEWKQISNKYPWLHLYEHIVMPNHLHGIIQIMDKKTKNFPSGNIDVIQTRMGTRPIPTPTLSDIIGGFKSITTNHYIQQVKQNHFPAFKKHMWQQRFYDRIIRHGNELNRMRNYIVENPVNWAANRNNPAFAAGATNG